MSLRAAGPTPALVLLLAASTAAAQEALPLPAPAPLLPPGLDASARLWVAPEAAWFRDDSPYAPAASRAGIGQGWGRTEVVLRARREGTVGELSLRLEDRGELGTVSAAVVTELYQELYLGAAGHLTVGKKVTPWDVSFGYRPLDVVQQERRLAFVPYALEGIPQLTWELFGEAWAVSILWTNPLSGRQAVPVHDEAGALHLFARAGDADVHGVSRWSERTGLQAGAGVALVAGETLELHGSARWQARGEHLAPPARGPGGGPITTTPPGQVPTQHELSAVAGLTLTPGAGLSFIAEGWLESRRGLRGHLAPARRARGGAALAPGRRRGRVPPAAVIGNLAWGLGAFDRPSLLRQNLFLHASRPTGRLEPAVDLLFTPEDRGWAVTGTAAWQGERLRAEGGVRLTGGPPGAAHRLFPAWAMVYVAAQLSL
ncbi:MAG: hypothetical protein QM767_11025 [Anaeromyxobacter sp.]